MTMTMPMPRRSLSMLAALAMWVAGCTDPQHGEGPPASVAPAVAAPTPTPASDPAALMRVAPELSVRSATLVLSQAPDGLPAEATAEHAFLLATAGFTQARPDDVSDLRRLMERVYSPLAAPDRAWMPVYIDRLRKGELSAAEATRGRTLLTTGILRLSEADRQRLQSIFERAIVEGIEQRRSAEARTAAYQEITPASPPPVATPAGVPAGTQVARTEPLPVRDGRGEEYWRRRMETARERVKKAEQALAEAESKETSVVLPGTGSGCSSSSRALSYKEYEACLARERQYDSDRLKRARTSSGNVRQSRAQLEAARKAVEALEDEARRAGAQPGWVR